MTDVAALTQPAENSRAPDAVFREHYQSVYRLALSLSASAADAEDIAQETFLAVFKGLDSFRGDASLGTWIYRITLRVGTRWMARRGPVMAPIDIPQTTSPNVPTDLIRALGQLPVQSRMIIALVSIEGLNHREAGEVLGIPEGTVASRLHVARKRLAELLG